MWSDCGSHFRSKRFLHAALVRLPVVLRDFLPALDYVSHNYFTEYHGKSTCDSHFGTITTWSPAKESACLCIPIRHDVPNTRDSGTRPCKSSREAGVA